MRAAPVLMVARRGSSWVTPSGKMATVCFLRRPASADAKVPTLAEPDAAVGAAVHGDDAGEGEERS